MASTASSRLTGSINWRLTQGASHFVNKPRRSANSPEGIDDLTGPDNKERRCAPHAIAAHQIRLLAYVHETHQDLVTQSDGGFMNRSFHKITRNAHRRPEFKQDWNLAPADEFVEIIAGNFLRVGGGWEDFHGRSFLKTPEEGKVPKTAKRQNKRFG